MKKPNKQANRKDHVHARQRKSDQRKRRSNARRKLFGMKVKQGGLPKGFKMSEKQEVIAAARKEFRSEKPKNQQ